MKKAIATLMLALLIVGSSSMASASDRYYSYRSGSRVYRGQPYSRSYYSPRRYSSYRSYRSYRSYPRTRYYYPRVRYYRYYSPRVYYYDYCPPSRSSVYFSVSW